MKKLLSSGATFLLLQPGFCITLDTAIKEIQNNKKCNVTYNVYYQNSSKDATVYTNRDYKNVSLFTSAGVPVYIELQHDLIEKTRIINLQNSVIYGVEKTEKDGLPSYIISVWFY